MPLKKPAINAGEFLPFQSAAKHGARRHAFARPKSKAATGKFMTRKVRFAGLLSSAIVSLGPSTAHAFEIGFPKFSPLFVDTNAVLMLAVFGGAMSFALLSAFWMIRERSRMLEENRSLKVSLSDLRATNDRNEALLNVPGQRIIVWNGTDERPFITGDVSENASTPVREEDFLAFGSWMDAESASKLEPLLKELRLDAKAFETVIKTRRGVMLDVRGNTSGSAAYVKFNDLDGARKEHAALKSEHQTLLDTYQNIEALLQNLPMPVWLKDPQGALSWVNRSYVDALEAKDREEVVEHNLELLDPELRERVDAAGREKSIVQEIVPVTVAGDRRKLELFCVQSQAGSAGLAVDKSDLDHVRRMLDEVNEGHARTLDQIATAVAIFDRSKKLVFYNSAFQHLWKFETAFLESHPSNAELLDVMRDGKLLPEHPDWRKWRDGQLEVYQALEPQEEWWHLLDGQTLRVVASPRNEGGATWIFENVTEQLALESNYNSLIRVQGETLDHLNDAVAVFGSDGRLRLFNPALEALWQKSDLMIAEGVHISKVLEAWTESISNESDLELILGQITGFSDSRDDLEGRMEMRDGTTLQYSVVPLPDGQSMLTLLDVTATVKFEKALRERAEALEASDLLKSKFIQHVSYQLRAPLTSISGFGELLETADIGTLNPKQLEYLRHINTSADELRMLVDDILDLASIDAGTMELELSQVAFTDAVDRAIAELASSIQQKGLGLNVVVQNKQDTLLADGERLHQILLNLFSNAVNFSPDGGTIEVSGARIGEFFEIRVLDDGPGIEVEERERVFDRFEARASTGGRHGTGLGLSLVRGFVDMHGGSISIEDTQNGGACFVCRFPDKPSGVNEPADDEQDPSVRAA